MVSLAEYKRGERRMDKQRPEANKDIPKGKPNQIPMVCSRNRTFRDVVAREKEIMGQRKNDRSGGATNDKKSNELQYEKTIIIYGEWDFKKKRVLERSMVGEALKPFTAIETEALLKVENPAVERTRGMGAYKALITFTSVQEKEMAIKNGGGNLSSFFREVREWTVEEVAQIKRVWVECVGVPLHT